MEKNEIISEIQQLARENDGKPPGQKLFRSKTGVIRTDWYPNYWLRWGDALEEAGFQPNKFDTALTENELIQKYLDLVRELGKIPIEGELIQKRKNDPSFPNKNAFRRLGRKEDLLKASIQFCENNNDYAEILSICRSALPKLSSISNSETEGEVDSGFVYLIQHGSRAEYKIGMTTNPIRREGEISFELPEKIKPIHYIETDDPSGIESYWHKRFAHKRKKGEWFKLTPEDVRSFKRWRKIF